MTQFSFNKVVLVLGVIIWIAMVGIFSVTLYLDLKPPKPREVHNNLLTLFGKGSPQEHQFKRLDILSNDYLFVASHGIGNPTNGIDIVTDDRWGGRKGLSVEELAQVILAVKNERNLDINLPIFLMACNAGAGNNSYAKRLSHLLGVDVVAPNEWLVVDQLGFSRTGGNLFSAYFNFGNMSLTRFSPAQVP